MYCIWMAQRGGSRAKENHREEENARLDVRGAEPEEHAHVEFERGAEAERTRVLRVAEQVRELRALLAQVAHALDAESAQHLLGDRANAADLQNTRQRKDVTA